jgi:hypothetical protein
MRKLERFARAERQARLDRGELPCERCNEAQRVLGERFCRDCRKSVLADLQRSGFLEKVPWRTRMRPAEKRQAHERDPSGSQENAVRDLEESSTYDTGIDWLFHDE